jgi:flagellar L-ring protein precursor FlgH
MHTFAIHRIALALAASLALGAGPLSGQRPGSIYDASRGLLGSISDKTARRPGDLITVLISENQNIANEESTDLFKSTALDYQLNAFDIKPNAFSVLPSFDSSTSDQLKGNAIFKKKDVFSARLTAIVVDSLPSGNLVISGRREIAIDGETRVIEFMGVIRRFDIQADNSIESELVADARISYTGCGFMSDSTNRRGLNRVVHELINWLWPF